jgi:hypothetical protein
MVAYSRAFIYGRVADHCLPAISELFEQLQHESEENDGYSLSIQINHECISYCQWTHIEVFLHCLINASLVTPVFSDETEIVIESRCISLPFVARGYSLNLFTWAGAVEAYRIVSVWIMGAFKHENLRRLNT